MKESTVYCGYNDLGNKKDCSRRHGKNTQATAVEHRKNTSEEMLCLVAESTMHWRF